MDQQKLKSAIKEKYRLDTDIFDRLSSEEKLAVDEESAHVRLGMRMKRKQKRMVIQRKKK